MKVLKGILYFILAIVVILALAALFAPSEKTVERSITIDAPASAVYPMVANFSNWQQWDPWFARDSTQERTYDGEPGEETYGYSWKSENPQVGNGSMYVTGMEENKNAKYVIKVGEGGQQMEMDGAFNFEEAEGKTTVSWSMTSNLGFPMKIMHYMTEKWVAPDFESGLASLKSLVESMPAKEAKEVKIITEFGVNYAVVEETVSFDAMDTYFMEAYPAIFGYMEANGVEPKGPASAFYYTWDTANKQTELAAAVAISDAMEEETTEVDIAVGKAQLGANSISYMQLGDYDQSADSHNALGAWMAENSKEFDGPVMEQYIKGPASEEDPANYMTMITYHFK